MATANTVSFVFQLVDQFSGMANRISAAAASAEKMIMGMGRSADRAERTINTLAANQGRVAQSFERSTRVVREAERANELYYKSAARIEKMQIGMLERNQAKQGLIAQGLLPGGSASGRAHLRQRGAMDMMNAYMGVMMVQGLQTGFGKFLDHSNAQRMTGTKMSMVGFKGDLLNEALKRAGEISGKYGNLSKADVMEQLYEGVAIYGDARHALENVEQQAKLTSFLNAFEGGTHSGKGNHALREVQAWIKSMEMKGTLNEHDPVKKQRMIDDYIQAGMAIKVAYGGQLNLSEMLLMQKRAGSSWYNFSDEFRFGYAPAMAQERGGQIVGTALMSAFSSIRGGKKLSKNELAMMSKYGLLDGSTGRWTQSFQDLWGSNPYLAAQDLVGRVAAQNKLDPHDEKQKDLLARELTKSFGWLFPNRTASTQFLDLAFNDENFRKHAEYMVRVREEMKEIEKAAQNGTVFAATTKGGAEASASKQWTNAMAAIGGPMLGPYIARLNDFASVLHRVAGAVTAVFEANPALGSAVGHAAMLGLGGLSAATLVASAGFLWGALKMGVSLLPFAGAGAARYAALPLMAGGAGLAGAEMAMAGGAAAVAVTRVGWMSRLMSLLSFGLLGAGRGVVGFHNAVNGLGAGLAIAGRVLRTSLAFLTIGEVWQHRHELGQIAADIGDFFKVWIGKEQITGGPGTRKAARKLAEDLGLDLDVPIEGIAKAIRKKFDELEKHLFSTGGASWARHWLTLDDWRLPYGKIGKATSYTPEVLELMNQAAGKTDWMAGAPMPGTDAWHPQIWDAMMRGQGVAPLPIAPPSATTTRGILDRIYGSAFGYPGDGGLFDAPADAGSGLLGGLAGNAARAIDFGAAPKGEGLREIAVRSYVEVTPSVPLSGTVAVTINGTVNGPVNGSGTANITGAVQAKSDAPRGESSPLNLGAGN